MDYNQLVDLLDNILCISSDEICTFIHDEHFDEILDLIQAECYKRSIHLNELRIDYDGKSQIDHQVQTLLTNETHMVFILGLVNSIWHLPERKHAKYCLGKRLANFVCSPDFLRNNSSQQAISCMNELGRSIQTLLGKANTVKVETNSGTNLIAKINSKSEPNNKYEPFLEVGPYSSPGSGGDYPFGEVGFGPELYSVSGTIVFDYKIQHIGGLNEPLIFQLRNDEVVDVAGNLEHINKYKELMARDKRLKYICEIAIGLNPNIIYNKNPYFICEEKTLGMVHFGFGGNFSYGDRHGPHFDGVVKLPSIYIDDNIQIMNSGKFNECILPNSATREWLKTLDMVFSDIAV